MARSLSELIDEHRPAIEDGLSNIQFGHAFILPDVIPAVWSGLEDADKRSLAKAFYSEVGTGPFEHLCAIGHPMRPAQEYVRFKPRREED